MSTHAESIRAAQAHWESLTWENEKRLLPHVESHTALENAREAAWRDGECCLACGENGKCLSRRVELSRHSRMYDEGMGDGSRRVMMSICEHSDVAKDIALAWKLIKDSGLDDVRLAHVAEAVIREAKSNGNGNG